MSNYIDPTTLQPPRFAELFSDRSIVVTGSARWSGGSVTTSNIKVILTPRGGGALSECSLPDASYALSADGASLWVQVNRDPGSHALTSQVYAAGSMPKLTGDWIPLFIRHAGVVYAYGGLQVSPFMHEIGAVNKISDYEYVVHASDPRATHTTIQSAIQQAITDSAEGARILVLNGTYDAGVGMSAGVGFYWSGISLSVEGEGWGTIITNNSGLTTAFGIGSFSATPTAMAGNGSRILNLRTQGFAQPVTLVAGFLGIRNCVVDVWAGAHSSYTDPSISGGLGSANDVTVRIYANTALDPQNQVKRYILGTDTSLVLHGQVGLDGLLAGPNTANLFSGTVIPLAITSGAGGYVVVTDERKMLRTLAFSQAPGNLGGNKTSLVLRNQLGDIEANKAVFTELNLYALAVDTTDDNYLLRVAAVTGGDVGTIKYSIGSELNTIVMRNASQKIFVGNIDASDIDASTLKLSGLISAPLATTVLVLDGTTVKTRTGSFGEADYLNSYLLGSDLIYWGWDVTNTRLRAKVETPSVILDAPISSDSYFGLLLRDFRAEGAQVVTRGPSPLTQNLNTLMPNIPTNTVQSNISFKYKKIEFMCDTGMTTCDRSSIGKAIVFVVDDIPVFSVVIWEGNPALPTNTAASCQRPKGHIDIVGGEVFEYYTQDSGCNGWSAGDQLIDNAVVGDTFVSVPKLST